MGRGNCCTYGPYEGLWYIDRDLIDVYYNADTDESRVVRDIDLAEFPSFTYSPWESEYNYDDMIEVITERMVAKFPSFTPVDRWVSDGGTRCDRHAFLENELFFIAVEDNEWSYAIELIQKGPENLSGLQKRFHQTYLDGIRDVILDYYGEVSFRRGAWMSGTIKKEVVAV